MTHVTNDDFDIVVCGQQGAEYQNQSVTPVTDLQIALRDNFVNDVAANKINNTLR